MFKFQVATANWLVQIASLPSKTQYTLGNDWIPLKFPMEDESAHPLLACLPEFIVETLVDTLTFIHRYSGYLFKLIMFCLK